jgi:hypothetical protein
MIMFLVIAYFLFSVFERVWKACLKDSLLVENIDVEMHLPWAVLIAWVLYRYFHSSELDVEDSKQGSGKHRRSL